jgi:hypothetical protein
MIKTHDQYLTFLNEFNLVTSETLLELANDEDKIVRMHVAYNPNTPVSALEKLSTDKNWVVRRNVAWNSNAPVNLLEKLSTDSNDHVRRHVAENPNSPARLFPISTKNP